MNAPRPLSNPYLVIGFVALLALAACGQSEPPAPESTEESTPEEVVLTEKVPVTTSSAEARAYYDEGLALADNLHFVEANAAFAKAVEADPTHFRAWFNMGIRHGKIPKNVQAMECFKKAVELRPEDAMAHYSLGLIHNLLGMIDESVHHYEEALKINPKFARAHSNLATVHYSVKRGREAIHHLIIAKNLFAEMGETQTVETADSLLQECYKEFNLSPEQFEPS